MTADRDELLTVGEVSGIYGVRGWVRVFSHADPPASILDFPSWMLERPDGWQRFELLEGRRHGKGLVARLSGIEDRDQARRLMGAAIAVERSALPPPGDKEYYWCDLIGLEVVTAQGQALGTVQTLMETGANDVLVVQGERERLVPFLPEEVVIEVDHAGGRIRVDWDPEF